MQLCYNGECLGSSAVSLYYLEKAHFTLVEEPKVFKINVWKIYSAQRWRWMFVVFKIRYIQIYTMFLEVIIRLFNFYYIFTIHDNWGFQSYLPAKHYFTIIFNT
jgi:hypothetical protein